MCEYHITNDKYAAVAKYISDRIKYLPTVAVVLGSGLSGFTGGIENAVKIKYSDIPFFPKSTAAYSRGNALLRAFMRYSCACDVGPSTLL